MLLFLLLLLLWFGHVDRARVEHVAGVSESGDLTKELSRSVRGTDIKQ